MKIHGWLDQLEELPLFDNLQLLANGIVEGFLNGMHKSPFHGFSSEFSEHKLYNTGDNTRHIDWKHYAKTEKLFVKRYEEEANMRCHFIIDNSSSMHYPMLKKPTIQSLNKICFSTLATVTLMNILKRQRDAVGLSIYSDRYEYYAPELGNERHRQKIIDQLQKILINQKKKKTTKTYKYLHLIAEKVHRRAMVILFSDMFGSKKDEKLFDALRHLKYNKHHVILFHVYDKNKELNFNFKKKAQKFIDVETGQYVEIFPESFQETYKASLEESFYNLKLNCAQYNIKYYDVDINKGLDDILNAFLIERQKSNV